MNHVLHFLLSDVYARTELHPDHAADLARSGLTEDTIRRQRIRTVMPPSIFDDLLGFRVPAAITSMYVIPFFASDGTLTDQVRVKVFPPITTPTGTIKYLQPRRSGVRVYFPLSALPQIRHSEEPLYLVEGEKKALAVAQLGLPTVGLCGIDGWHLRGARELHPDLHEVPLRRPVEIVPDADYKTNPAVARAAAGLADALERRGARVRLVSLPEAA